MSHRRVPRALVRRALPLLIAATVVAAGACAAESEVSAGDSESSSTKAPSTSTPQRSDLTVTADEDESGSLFVVVDDRAAPGGAAARQCVHVRVSSLDTDVAVAEGSSCNAGLDGVAHVGSTVDADGTVVVPLIASVEGVEIGSACVVEPTVEPVAEPAEVRTAFRFDAPAELEPGPYEVTVSATSGATPGCPGEPGASGAADDATEHRARTTAEVDLG